MHRDENKGRQGDLKPSHYDNKIFCYNCSENGHTSSNCAKSRINKKHVNFQQNRSENAREIETDKIANDGRPNPNQPFRRQFTQAPNGRANTSNRTNVNVVQSMVNRGKKEIKGYCSLNGRPVPFLVDTGASRSVVSQRVLGSTASMRPFTSQATTADGAELKIKGVKDCLVKIDDSSYMTSVLVAPDF